MNRVARVTTSFSGICAHVLATRNRFLPRILSWWCPKAWWCRQHHRWSLPFANAIDECPTIPISWCHHSNCLLARNHWRALHGLGGMLINYSTAEHPQDRFWVSIIITESCCGQVAEIICELPYCATAPLKLELSNNLVWDPHETSWYGANINLPKTILFPGNELGRQPLLYQAGFSIRHDGYPPTPVCSEQGFASGNKMNLYPDYSDYQLCYCCNDFNQAGSNPNTDFGIAQKVDNKTWFSFYYLSRCRWSPGIYGTQLRCIPQEIKWTEDRWPLYIRHNCSRARGWNRLLSRCVYCSCFSSRTACRSG